MTKPAPGARPGMGQDPLPLTVEGTAPGRLEQAVTRTVEAAVGSGQLGDLDAAAAQLAVECARACDIANQRRDPYAFPQPARELRETLTRLKLDPTARGGNGRDPFAEWLADLANDGPAGQVRDPAQP